jgi:hypothetical protein
LQLEAAHSIEITKPVGYVDRKQGPPIRHVRTYRHNINSALLQTDRCLKTEVQIETREINGSHSRENKRKIAREEEERIIATLLG